jgi:dihydroorotate dehydrogenase subfamily 2
MRFCIGTITFLYQYLLKPFLFLIDPEFVHVQIVKTGETLGKYSFTKSVVGKIFKVGDPSLEQKIAGVKFQNPVGLAAGFDYEARLTQILPAVGFGFETVGTITNKSYSGNPKPMLGRLPKSRSLMVNKGFKNPGANEVIKKLAPLKFEIPIGVSIGRTNSRNLPTEKESIKDIVSAFNKFENAKLRITYYELNISCPNLFGNISFYPPNNLKDLLTEVEKLKIKKPLFIKMPIEKSDQEVLEMLDVISDFTIKGVIFGNLQKNRKDPAIMQDEVSKFKVGNFSGKPTEKRSNELIKLCYQNFKKRFVIIGCGGIFGGQDAYKKIMLGASLVQLITGMVFQGPQLIGQINLDLIDLLKKDGFHNISDAVGSSV